MVSPLRLVEVRQRFDAPSVPDLSAAVRKEVHKLLREATLAPGARVGITAGSRGIAGVAEVCRAAVETLKEAGYEPFLFSSMGSHGGGTAEGQRDLLTSLDVTEEKVGAPVSCSDEVVELGETGPPLAGLPVYVAREAVESDAVLVLNRVKPHTSFHGPHESGLLKMLAVGMGRAKGATMVHRLGWDRMSDSVAAIGGAVLDRLRILGGLALVENAREETAVVEGLAPGDLLGGEARLLKTAWSLMPSLPVDDIDLLVVREMGKDYSGTGMDTNIIGRLRLEGIPEPERPRIKYLAVLELSEASHGNATGIGLADFTTERLVARVDRKATYLNCLTTGGPIRAAIPMIYPTDEDLFEAALQALKPDSPEDVRLVIVDNTLHLGTSWLSENLAGELKEGAGVVGEPVELGFDTTGRMTIQG